MTDSNRLSPLALGLSLGIVWAIYVIIITALSMWFDYGTAFVTALSTVYIGFESTWLGMLIGTAFAFIDGLIAGLLIGFFYNLCLRSCRKKNQV